MYKLPESNENYNHVYNVHKYERKMKNKETACSESKAHWSYIYPKNLIPLEEHLRESYQRFLHFC